MATTDATTAMTTRNTVMLGKQLAISSTMANGGSMARLVVM